MKIEKNASSVDRTDSVEAPFYPTRREIAIVIRTATICTNLLEEAISSLS